MPLPDSVLYLTAAVSTVSVIGGAYNAYQLYQRNKRINLPKEWVHIGHVKRLYVYPIKGCAPIILNQAECSPIGLKDGWLRDSKEAWSIPSATICPHDGEGVGRCRARTADQNGRVVVMGTTCPIDLGDDRFLWVLMIIDTDGNHCVRAQTFPKMLKINSSIKKAILTLNYPEMEAIDINLAEVIVMKKILYSTVYTSSVAVYDCGEEASEWINKCLNIEDTTFRLVYYASEKNRPIDGPVSNWPKIYDVLRKTDTGAFADEVSCHVINEASIEDLNSRLTDVQITDSFFRPNILLSEGKAFDEDNWKFVKIGDNNIFQVIKPCVRCIVTTLDPETGTRNKDREPLRTLKRYRLPKDPQILKAAGDSPQMGIHMALRSGPCGIISVNDPFFVAY